MTTFLARREQFLVRLRIRPVCCAGQVWYMMRDLLREVSMDLMYRYNEYTCNKIEVIWFYYAVGSSSTLCKGVG